jgi:murein DD-endopeptidase MepM/ murein hydrolase activator NlpD
MPPFDARREPVRFAPALAAVAAAVCAAGLTMATTKAAPAPKKADKSAVQETKAEPNTKAAEAGRSAKAKAEKAGAAKQPESKTAKGDTAKERTSAKRASDEKTGAKRAEADKAAEKTKTAQAGDKDKGAKTSAAEKSKTAKADAKDKAEPKRTAKAEAEDKPQAKKTAKIEAKDGAELKKTAKAESKGEPGLKTTAKAEASETKAEPKYRAAQNIKVKLRKGETLEAAIRRAEASPEDAKSAAARIEKALGKAPPSGQLFTVEVAPREGRVGAGRLMALTMKGSAFEPVELKRSKGGELTLAARARAVADDDDHSGGRFERAKLITGEVRGSLYGSARKAGVGANQVGEIVKAFAAKVDFQRELKVGDKFTVVYDDSGRLLYAKIKSKGSYRFARKNGEVMWLDDDGKSLKHGLLRTPVDGARMSSRFGLRIHPILGYAKMHQGVDFAAASGTPIMAAGDGTVVEIKRWGGYGNWLRIKHSGGYESGYAHLSRYASGLKVGDKVKQGELVAYVGSTGASTGPHLHHEIWLHGQRVDPRGARIPTGFALEGKELAAFKAQQATVKAALARGDTQFAEGERKTRVAGLRPAKSSEA